MLETFLLFVIIVLGAIIVTTVGTLAGLAAERITNTPKKEGNRKC